MTLSKTSSMSVLILNKPKNLSSFKSLKVIQNLLGLKKAGHAGTLDPLATGILPIFFDRSTKFIQYMPEQDKTYHAKFKLGCSSDTEDIEGNIIYHDSEQAPSMDNLKESVSSFIGSYQQNAPLFSAKKVNGVAMYKLARKGIELEKRSQKVHIKSLELLSYSYPYFEIEAKVSRGTYVRTLGVDIADKLGCNCVLTDLCRTGFGPLKIKDAITIDTLKNLDNKEKMQYVMRVEEILKSIPKLNISSTEVKKFQNGLTFSVTKNEKKEKKLVFYKDEFIGIGEIGNEEKLRPIKLYKI